MSLNRRILIVLTVSLAVAAPAVTLRLLCVGRSCLRPSSASTPVPFCSLPSSLRTLIEAGFRDGRGPHIMAVADHPPVFGATGLDEDMAPWPSLTPPDDRVPLVVAGTGVDADGDVPAGTGLDAVAPTLADLIGLDRPHPGVRSGEAVPGLSLAGVRARLVLEVAWKGVGSSDLRRRPEDWPTLRSLLHQGAGTLDAQVRSLPLDPAAVLTTIGTGGLPSDHGITGTTVRNDQGRAVTAWGPRSPFSVIATLGDDLDELLGQAPRIGLVGGNVADRGLVGGDWYITNDRDDLVIEPRVTPATAAADRLLTSGYGSDRSPDLLAVAMEGPIPSLDRALGRLVEAADRASGGSAVVIVTATGATPPRGAGIAADEVERSIERRFGNVVEATALGGFFLDQAVMARTGISDDRVAQVLRERKGPTGATLMADVFPQIAVTFARYC
jgi:hypothetical protein